MTDEQAERLIAAVMTQTTVLTQLLARMPTARKRKPPQPYHEPTQAQRAEARARLAHRRRLDSK